MIDAIIRGSLGEFGSALLDFYIENNVWINGLILLYALLLVLAKGSYKKIREALRNHLVAAFGERASDKNTSWYQKTLERSSLDWGSIGKAAWFPLISPEKSLWFKLKNPATLKALFTPEKISEIMSGSDKALDK